MTLALRGEAAPPVDTLADQWALTLPNIRSLFLPDPGHILIEGDLARADAQVIAWEADARDLKDQLRHDIDIHSDNADMLFAHVWRGHTLVRVREINPRAMHSCGMSYRDCAKRYVHATNFRGGSRTVASTIVVPEPHVAACQRWWTEERHPEIGALHRRVEHEIKSRKNPVIHNRFGFRRAYVGGDRTGNLVGQALAWVAQSTVAVVINTGLLQLDPDALSGILATSDYFPPWARRDLAVPEFTALMQIHDSVLGQLPLAAATDDTVRRFDAALAVPVPYDDPLVIAREVKWSATDWGSMQKWQYGKTRLAA